ncbi:hypothetical protein ACFVY1_39035 [Streptomyces sp. NPDC058293]|uniref:Uncharacterized protein n=1 Tax=Streptomyces sp. NBC_00119 TaxID=2975659 RepID=A0AAU1UL03_9ACTN|nr:hypothetical protein [Streptomyces sp. NBC_01446]MCX4649743.1 hypothetical protein [Streptomyces sp. NBC_01446]
MGPAPPTRWPTGAWRRELFNGVICFYGTFDERNVVIAARTQGAASWSTASTPWKSTRPALVGATATGSWRTRCTPARL